MSDYYEPEAIDDLAARLDRLEEAVQEPEYDTEDDFLPYQVAAETLQDGQTAREYLAGVAEQTRNEVIARSGVDPNAARDPVEIAVKMVASSIPTWEEDAPAVQEYLSQSGVDLGPLIASGDATAIAKLLYTAQMNVKVDRMQGQSNREIKRAAQTMSGSNSARETDTAWDQIVRVGDGRPRMPR